MKSNLLRKITLKILLCLFPTCTFASFGWTVEHFFQVPGAKVSDLSSHPSFYSASKSFVTSSSSLTLNIGDQYGTRIRGYIVPPTSGLYTFWENGGDAVSLFLSADENPANKQLIASHQGSTGPLDWIKYSTQQSRPIPLVAGKKYYIELLHKQSSASGHLPVAWTTPRRGRSVIPLNAMLPFISSVYEGSPGLLCEVYDGLSGTSIAALLNSPNSLLKNTRIPAER